MITDVEQKWNIQIIFRTLMQKSSLCDYSDAYIFIRGTKTIIGGPDDATEANKRENKNYINGS